MKIVLCLILLLDVNYYLVWVKFCVLGCLWRLMMSCYEYSFVS